MNDEVMNSSVINFPRGLLESPRCDGCKDRGRCVLVYDAHHDQFFSLLCGLVVMEMGEFLVDYSYDINDF